MNFQLMYYKLLAFVQECLAQGMNADIDPIRDSLRNLATLLNELEPILHQEAMAVQLEPLPSDNPAAVAEKNKWVALARKKAAQALAQVLNQYHPLAPHALFHLLSVFLARQSLAKGVELAELKKSVSLFCQLFNVKITYEPVLLSALDRSFKP